MLRIWRTSAATRAAIAALAPLVEQSRRRLGGVPDRVWSEPYMLGLVMTLITLSAQRRCAGRLTSEDLGLVQLQAWQRLTGVPDDVVGELICRLSAGGDDLFEWGCRRGGRLFAQLQREPSRRERTPTRFAAEDEAPAGVHSDPPQADAAALWQRYFDERMLEMLADAR